jgi:hypothetical protein
VCGHTFRCENRHPMRFLWLAIVMAFVVACSSPAPTSAQPTTPPLRPRSDPSPPGPAEKIRIPSASTAPAVPHVFVVVMENKSLTTALRAPSISSLAAKFQLLTNYRAVSSPSLPNYLALTSGSTWGISDNGYHALPAGGIGGQLTGAGVSWRAYMEGLTSEGCMRSPYPYALKHNPFAYYGGSCPENVVALDRLDADLAHDTPSFVWITPGLCHDGHDCALTVAGAWLDDLIGRIVASPAWREDGVLFIVWDEGDGGSDIVPLIVASPALESRRIDGAYDHYSLLAAIEDLFGLPRLGAASDAQPLTDLLPLRTR